MQEIIRLANRIYDLTDNEEIESLCDSIVDEADDHDCGDNVECEDCENCDCEDLQQVINGMEEITYHATNFQDREIMEALEQAYSRSTPIKILEALNNLT